MSRKMLWGATLPGKEPSMRKTRMMTGVVIVVAVAFWTSQAQATSGTLDILTARSAVNSSLEKRATATCMLNGTLNAVVTRIAADAWRCVDLGAYRR